MKYGLFWLFLRMDVKTDRKPPQLRVIVRFLSGFLVKANNKCNKFFCNFVPTNLLISEFRLPGSYTTHLYNIYTMLEQRRRRWADVL